MRSKLSLAEHPWSVVALGALAGVWLASYRRRKPSARPPGLLATLLGGFALQLVRDAAMFQMSKIAKTLFVEEQPPPTPYAS